MVENRIEGFVDNDLLRIHKFQQQLATVDSVKPHNSQLDFVKEELPVDALMRQFTTYELRAEPTVYLNSDHIKESVEAPIYFMPRMARGSRHSAHGVFFGDLIFADYQHVSVAVKPHETDSTASCLRDYYNTEAVRQLGLDGLTSVGFMIHEGHPAYSFTKLDRSLSTLDSIDWTNYFANRDLNPGMTDIWQRVSRQMALIHSLGSIAHGDMAARNIATTNQGNVFFIDWERAYISLRQPRDAEIRYGLSHADINTLLESLWLPPHSDFKAGVGLFYGQNEEEVWPVFRNMFLDEYIVCRQQYAAEGKHNHRTVDATEEELDVLESSLLEDMAMYAQNLGSLAVRQIIK